MYNKGIRAYYWYGAHMHSRVEEMARIKGGIQLYVARLREQIAGTARDLRATTIGGRRVQVWCVGVV